MADTLELKLPTSPTPGQRTFHELPFALPSPYDLCLFIQMKYPYGYITKEYAECALACCPPVSVAGEYTPCKGVIPRWD